MCSEVYYSSHSSGIKVLFFVLFCSYVLGYYPGGAEYYKVYYIV